MVIGSFGSTSGWAGREIDYDNGLFSVNGEALSLADLLAADQQGLIVWAYDGLQQWAQQLSTAQSAVPAPAPLAEATPAPVVPGLAPAAPEASGPGVPAAPSPDRKSPPTRRRLRTRTKIIIGVVGAFVILTAIGAIGNAVAPSHKTSPTPAPMAATTTAPTPTETPSTGSSASTPNDKLPMRVIKKRVRAILTANVDHYAKLLAAGERALGSTQYANANAGLAAFNDPNSAASKFRDYQGGQGRVPRTTCRSSPPSSRPTATTRPQTSRRARSPPGRTT